MFEKLRANYWDRQIYKEDKKKQERYLDDLLEFAIHGDESDIKKYHIACANLKIDNRKKCVHQWEGQNELQGTRQYIKEMRQIDAYQKKKQNEFYDFEKMIGIITNKKVWNNDKRYYKELFNPEYQYKKEYQKGREF